MGNWLTTALLRFEIYWFPPRHKYIGGIDIENQRTFVATVAARIAHLPRMTEDRHSKSDDDTDFSDDDECPQMSAAEEQKMFERERQIAFRGRLTIGNQESVDDLREDIDMRCGCGPSTSLFKLCEAREIGAKGRHTLNARNQAALVNRYMPNRRKIVDSLKNTKSFCCQYADNGRQLVVASQDEKIRFYHRAMKPPYHSRFVQFKELQVTACSWSILDVAINDRADLLCYSTWRNAVFLAAMNDREMQNGQNAIWHQIDLGDTEHNVAVFSLKFSDDNRQVVCGSSTYCISLIDVERRIPIQTIDSAHEDDVNSVCFADESSNLIYSGGDDGLVKVWDRRAWNDGDMDPVGVFAGHRDGVTYIDSRRDDRYLLSNAKDQTIKVWDLRHFSSQRGIEGTRQCVQKQDWDYRWHPAPPGLCEPVDGDSSVMTLRGHSVLHTLVRAKFSPERTGHKYIYTGCARGEIVVYDMLTGSVSSRLKGHMSVVRDVDWHPCDNEIASCGWDSKTCVWQYDERAERITAPYDGAQFGDDDSCDENYEKITRTKASTRKRQSPLRKL
ncbi:unnamed protein product [Caenorhabditis bovis]|uniref:DDB1- and CUL4-associated factor 11 homolog n=1 Tax=Caenorhabditis bovis TaxID=2654633 RepID=A0A8S1F9T1_9PELO|nr:unnamed protein product [Caenorhabditis bovis]